jgi:penicillin-binding protein 1A
VHYQDIPINLRHAILAAEDADFFRHFGLSIPRLAVTLMTDIVRRQSAGASTLTQQLARNLFPTTVGFDRTWTRKIKEALVAVQIEKRYTKEEIFTMYCNQINWGHGAYGVEAASRLYFGKSVRDVNLEEAAMLAGIIQGNVRQSPYVNMDNAVRRRNYALRRMAEAGYITQAQSEASQKKPIVTSGDPSTRPSLAPYFSELIRQHLEERYGAKAIYEQGLTIRTGLDPALQRAANRALDDGLRRIDRLHGYRRPAHNLIAEGKAIDSYKDARWAHDPAPGQIVPAVITAVDGGAIHVRAGRWAGTIDRAGYKWTGRTADQLAKRGDVIEVRAKSVDARATTFSGELEQPPLVEGAVLAIDNHTGEILTLIGGSDFRRTKFNRATQALRQVGSAFKPFVFTTAIDRGYTVSTILSDTPVTYNPGPNQPPYEPKNYEGNFLGDIPLHTALEHSRNVPTIKLMDALGPQQVIDYARRFGITAPLQPYLPTAIGAGDITLIEMTSAYTAFPNQGVRMTPVFARQVVDRDGNVLEDNRAEPREAIRADTAYVMTTMLEGVMEVGTAAEAGAKLKWPLGGKTGTTDNFTDAWFIGFDPDITIGVWVGYDLKKPLGQGQSGAVAALPIWMDIMRTWIGRQRTALSELPHFERPGNVVLVAGGDGTRAYIAGTEPGIR